MEVNDQLHARRKEHPVPTGYWAGWAQEPVWTRWRREKSLPWRETNTGRPARDSVIILTELQRIITSNVHN